MLAGLHRCTQCWDDTAENVEDIRQRVREILTLAHCSYIGTGRQREVWQCGNYVIKVPVDLAGLEDNWHERSTWIEYHHTDSYIPYASCRLLCNTFLLMEYAHFSGPLSDEDGFIPYENLPEWASYVDGQQVGYNRKGKIVAYDFGIW